jgi:hypothetical protein
MIHLIGVDHRIQVGGGLDAVTLNKFLDHLNDVIRKESVSVVAEEYSEEAITKYRQERSKVVALSVAEEHGLRHIFCDPNSDERREIGHPTDEEIKGLYLESLHHG